MNPICNSYKIAQVPSASPVEKIPIPGIAFGKAKWEKYIGDIGEEPPLPLNIHGILNSPCPIWEGKMIGDTHLLILVPSTVNGQPLTLSHLGELVKNPKEGHSTCYNLCYTLGNENVRASENYWILMTKDVIPESRNKTYDQQVDIVKNLALKLGHSYRVPCLIEAATAIFMHYFETGKRLYGDNPWTWTRCQEQSSGKQMVVGGFVAAGLAVCSYGYNRLCGVGGVWKL